MLEGFVLWGNIRLWFFLLSFHFYFHFSATKIKHLQTVEKRWPWTLDERESLGVWRLGYHPSSSVKHHENEVSQWQKRLAQCLNTVQAQWLWTEGTWEPGSRTGSCHRLILLFWKNYFSDGICSLPSVSYHMFVEVYWLKANFMNLKMLWLWIIHCKI